MLFALGECLFKHPENYLLYKDLKGQQALKLSNDEISLIVAW